MLTLDEFGEVWDVQRGDPAHEALKQLVAAGFPEAAVVLPQELLLGGSERQRNWEQLPDGCVGEAFLRWCRLYDCVQALGRSYA